MDKDPSSFAWITYAWVIVLSVIGGVVNFMRKLTRGISRPFNIVELIGELVTSGFAGVLTFWLCVWSGVSPLLTGVIVGVAGHMGSRLIFILEEKLEQRLTKL